MTDDPEFFRGSGNVFADLADADADTKQFKAQLAAEIISTLRERRLSVGDAAVLADVEAPVIQRIRDADLSRFTLDRLIRIAYRLGRRVEVRVLPSETANMAA